MQTRLNTNIADFQFVVWLEISLKKMDIAEIMSYAVQIGWLDSQRLLKSLLSTNERCYFKISTSICNIPTLKVRHCVNSTVF